MKKVPQLVISNHQFNIHVKITKIYREEGACVIGAGSGRVGDAATLAAVGENNVTSMNNLKKQFF